MKITIEVHVPTPTNVHNMYRAQAFLRTLQVSRVESEGVMDVRILAESVKPYTRCEHCRAVVRARKDGQPVRHICGGLR